MSIKIHQKASVKVFVISEITSIISLKYGAKVKYSYIFFIYLTYSTILRNFSLSGKEQKKKKSQLKLSDTAMTLKFGQGH